MTDDGLEAPIGPVLRGPRGSHERLRIGAVAVIAVLVVGAGIGLAGNGFTSPPQPSPSSTGLAGGSPTPGTSPDVAVASPTSTQAPGQDCALPGPGVQPELGLQTGHGETPVSGLPAPTAPASPGGQLLQPVPPVTDAVHLDTAGTLILTAAGDACIARVVADYWPADPAVQGAFPVAFRSFNIAPVGSIVPLGSLPSGDWVVGIEAWFSAITAGQQDAGSAVRYFRVISGVGAGPLPTSAVPPAVPCVGGVPEAVPDLILTSPSTGPVVGIPAGTGTPPLTDVTLGEPLEIRIAGDRCAIAWSIDNQAIDLNQALKVDGQDNPTNDPFLSTQDRWRLDDLPTGLDLITATVRFSADVSISRRWSLIVTAPPFPDAQFLAADGSPDGPVATAVAGCGTTWSYVDATGGSETCSKLLPDDALNQLTVPQETPVRLDIPGWTVDGWTAACGRLDAGVSPSDPFVVVDGCDLGGSGVPGPIVFLPRSSGPVVRVSVSASRDDGTSVNGTLYVMIESPASVVTGP